MMLRLPLFVALVALSACAPVSLYYKEGAAVSRQKSDLLSCEVDALAKAPVATQIRQAPPYYIPSRRYCRPDGSCYHRGGYFAGGELYSVDVNARLRRDLRIQCMDQRGYRPVELPRCANGTQGTVATGTDGSVRMPPIGPDSCVSKDTAGEWQIITPRG